MLRTLFWKEWRQLRQLRWVGAGLALLLPIVALIAPSAARQGWIPFAAATHRYSAAEILWGALPVALGYGLWPLLGLLMTAQAFSGDRASGTESFLLERPVPRSRVWIARTLASFGSTGLVAAASLGIWLALAATVGAPAGVGWSTALRSLLLAGSLASAGCLLGGMIAASLLSSPLAALLLGVVLVMVPVLLAGTLGEWCSHAIVGDLPVGVVATSLLLVVYPLASWLATCRGEPAGRGRIVRGTATLAVGFVAVGLLFVASAPAAVRVLAQRLDDGADVGSSAGESAYFGSQRGGGWIVDLETRDRLRFLPPPVWRATWSADGNRMAVLSMSGPLGSVRPAVRIEFYDSRGRPAGRTLHYDGEAWPYRMRWAGERLALYEVAAGERFGLRIYDPQTGESKTAEAPQYQRMTGFVGPVSDGRLFAVVRERSSVEDDRPGARFGVFPVDLDSGEVGEEPLVEDSGPWWLADGALSPSGRYWILDRGATGGEVRPVLDLVTGEEIRVEGLTRGARWIRGDVLFWIESDGAARRLVRATPGGSRAALRSWTDLGLSLQVSPDLERLLIGVVRVLEDLPTSEGPFPLRQESVATWVYEAGADRWTELAAWPPRAYEGYRFRTTWAGPATLARTGPGFLGLEDLRRPGDVFPVIGALDDGS